MRNFFVLLLLATTLTCTFANKQRNTYNFNSDWKMKIGDFPEAKSLEFDDSAWEKISLPRAFNEDEAFKLHISEHSDTIVWYRKNFKLPKEDQGKKVFIEFEGVRFAAEVYVNGKFAGLHENGVMAFGFDISQHVNYKRTNLISIRVDNDWNYKEKSTGSGFQWNNNNFNANYGGIPKNIKLHCTEHVYQTLPLFSNLNTTGTYIYATNFDLKNKNAVIHAESEVKNETKTTKEVQLEVTVYDLEGKFRSKFISDKTKLQAGEKQILKANSLIKDLHFWSWGYGYLYDVYTCLILDGKVQDTVKTRTGFRKTEFKNGMIILNDRPIQIKGYAQRTSNEWPGVGMSVAPWLSDFSNQMIVEGNGNMVRWMHVTPWKQDVESCDRVGLMQMFPAGDAEKDVEGRRWEQRKELMRDAIIYNRNNPSLILYESGNESISEAHMDEMKAIRDCYDPHGGRAIGSREMLDSKIAEYGGEMLYINKSAHKPLIATEYCRDEALRKYWDEFTPPYHKDGAGPLYRNADASAYNRNQDSFVKEEVKRWNDYFEMRPGTGKRVSGGGLNIVFSDTNTHDRGEENYRRSGETDAVRIPKDVFFAHQVMWDGWVDIENYRTHIVGHWNYTPGIKKDILVVSSSEKVELFLNGKSKGIGTRTDHFLHIFENIDFEAGEIKAISMDSNNQVQSQDKIKTTGKAHALKLKIVNRPTAVKADGADMVLIQVEVVDTIGTRCPDVHPLVKFEIEGPADWRGGIGQGTDNCILSKILPAECGINRAIIRSTTTSGKISIKVSSEGLISDQISFETVQFDSQDGLSKIMVSDNLPSFLGKGETPSSPSFRTSRESIEILKATSGSSSQDAILSYDDNELTEWRNDGTLETGWINYELIDSSVVNQICLKLSGWRSRTYPIEILIDNILVWKGETQQSLGYVTLSFPETKGKNLTIRLTGTGTEQDAFGNVVELSGNKELDGFRDPANFNNKGNLRIIEAEILRKR